MVDTRRFNRDMRPPTTIAINNSSFGFGVQGYYLEPRKQRNLNLDLNSET